MRQPNILLIQVDQMSASALPVYGNEFSIAPNIGALSDGAVVFDNAYCNYPICAPSRFAMMTGQLPSRINAFDNAAELPAAIPTFAHYLRAAGYATTLSGKMHFVGPDQLHGFEERLTAELYPTDFTWNKVGSEFSPEQVSDARGILRAGPTANTVQIEHDELVAFRTKRKLFDLGAGGDDRPFLLTVSFTHPHEPYLCKQAYWDLYDGIEIPAPRVPRIAPEKMDPLSHRVAEMWSLFDDFGDESVAVARRGYFANVSYVDQLIGEVMSTLHLTGLDNNTVVVFTSDHGDMLGERGLWYKKVFFEPAARVPLIIKAPNHLQSGRVSQPVSLVDLLPTLCSFGSTTAHYVEKLDGRDLLAVARGDVAEQTDVYSEIMSEGLAQPVVMIRRGAFKFIAGPTHSPQLYDLANDPDETNDLAQCEAHAALVAELVATMHKQWDFDVLNERILLTQKRRALIHTAHYQGQPPVWDYAPANDEARWLRGNTDYGDWAFADIAVRK